MAETPQSGDLEFAIAPLKPEDWPAIRAIYGEGIAAGNATFETETPDWPAWDAGHLQVCRLVARQQSEIVGWAALSAVSRRSCYAGVAEVSVYVASAAQGHGIGASLLQALITESERNGIWTLQATIFPENIASLKMHESHGFRVVGIRERLGCRDGQWRDVVLMERRSDVAGT